MKKLLILLFLLTGCSTMQIINPNLVKANEETMRDCSEYKVLDTDKLTTNDFLELIYDNAKIYKDCKTLNEAKKEFILRQQKSLN